MEACRAILQEGLQALNIEVDEHQLGCLLAFIQLIEKWNKAYNLTAVRCREDMARLHILDSLTMLPFIKGECVADIGTGAGLPGIPLAIFLPNTKFTLVDSNSKKTRFVQQAVLELKLKNVTVIHSRVEQVQVDIPFSSVIVRAFSSLKEIVALTRHLINEQGVVLAMKGQMPSEELNGFSEKYTIASISLPGVDAERCLIQIEGGSEHG